MKQKLTLTIDAEVIKAAKKYAKNEGRSLSTILENYLKLITKERQQADVANENDVAYGTISQTPITDLMYGMFALPEGVEFDEDEVLWQALKEKYLKD